MFGYILICISLLGLTLSDPVTITVGPLSMSTVLLAGWLVLALTITGIPSRCGIVCWLPLAMLPLAFTHLYLKPHVAHADPGPRPGAAGSREHPLAIPV